MEFDAAVSAMMACDLFSELSESEQGGLLMRATTRHCGAGTAVYEKDQKSGSSFALIADGCVNILGQDGAVLETVGMGSIIGEIGPVSPQKKRTFRVEACGDVDLLEWYLSDIEEKYPAVLKRLRDLAWDRITQWRE
ncbi:MAG TPA: cyclic nucleotide-binding domain-containing protein [Kiritimatiellia bacterium]|nr:cyclic nucleotide-binding domain-containing protein [Kiritimatiellia bacterium]HNR93247.1 cyclic nucleotide-binding domain-containing protein [Kiritimatiellia bacterium]HNS80055.1 cyclic nucleotide-binding domain-containing protein [Kiritimatiellia bacterium]HPA77916.1 cyclic nucleotide-binding domain-containing protein [Kiritimatiellia bacterium]HQQ04003.1 cyclic nucleotide-binding domain-containing protein [Kiritimatiellia bacterium]